jgi:hypothetical protein
MGGAAAASGPIVEIGLEPRRCGGDHAARHRPQPARLAPPAAQLSLPLWYREQELERVVSPQAAE